MNRRSFLRSSAVLAAFSPLALRAQQPGATPAAGAASAAPAATKPKRANKKGFMWSTLNSPTARELNVRQKFDLLKEAGFDGVEMASAMNQEEVLAARDATGLAIPSVVVSTHWAQPLSDNSPAVRAKGLEGLLQGLRDAKAYGAKSILFVPGAVTKDVSYEDCYKRSVEGIKQALPLAKELGVIIAIENVWNRFLLSPMEAAQYVDSFQSPYVKWHLDAGNLIDFSWTQHWVRTLGSRIVAVHVKEYSRKLRDEKGPRTGFQVDLFDGDTDWPAVMKAFDDVKYSGWMITEQWRAPNQTDAAWLKHLSGKLDQVLSA